MKIKNLKFHMLFLFLWAILSCSPSGTSDEGNKDQSETEETENTEEENEEEEEEEEEETTEIGVFNTIFFDDFNNLTNWEKTDRADYNSSKCLYKPDRVSITSIGGAEENALLLIAEKLGDNNFEGGHIKSLNQFMPEKNEELRFTGKIKLYARNSLDGIEPFYNTYGAWPAFWTVEEDQWPTKGEIDIMEAYTRGDESNDKYACNIFYGTTFLKNELKGTVKGYTGKINSTDWNFYEMLWTNDDGAIKITINVNNKFIKEYTNATVDNLKLENFTPHNIILNLNVGHDGNIFDNSLVDLQKQVEMLVDWVKVEKKTLR